jgi:hypothetical protein
MTSSVLKTQWPFISARLLFPASAFNLVKDSGDMCSTSFNIKMLWSFAIVYLYVPCDSNNKQQLFH